MVALPSKHVSPPDSLLYQAAELHAALPAVCPLDHAWERCRERGQFISFDRFVLMLDVLRALGLLDLQRGVLVKRGDDAAPTER